MTTYVIAATYSDARRDMAGRGGWRYVHDAADLRGAVGEAVWVPGWQRHPDASAIASAYHRGAEAGRLRRRREDDKH